MSEKKRSKHQFFVVFSPDGETPPKVVHPTHKGALYAAVQMAKLNPEASFFVMGSMSRPINAESVAAADKRRQAIRAEQEQAKEGAE
jgi:hypothetical protein